MPRSHHEEKKLKNNDLNENLKNVDRKYDVLYKIIYTNTYIFQNTL